MLRNSIRGRVIATVILSQSLLAVGVLLAGTYYTYRRLRTALDQEARARALSIAALVRYNEDASGNVYFDDSLVPAPLDPHHPDLFAVWTERSGLLARSPQWPAGLDVPAPTGRPHWHFVWAQIPYRGVRISGLPVLDREEGGAFQPQKLTIIYATPILRLQAETGEAAVFIAVASLVLLGVTSVLALWGIRRGLLPLQHLAGQASSVSAQNWKLNLPPEAQQLEELRPLIESMTTMLARLETSFAQEKQFMGNAAHELKTPVAVLKSTLQSLLCRPRSAEEYRTGLEQSLEDLERLEHLLQRMLRLARAEQWAHGALRRDLPTVDLTATCDEAIARIRGLAESRKMQIHLSAEARVRLKADPEDLQLVWANLLENAVRYSPEGGSLEVAVTGHNGGTARVSFQDHGLGIPSADLPHIFERFYRGDPSRTRATGGFGLGLAIAKVMVEAYGGTIQAESTPGQGTRMTVELPITPN
jgi:heavy metal sensor kinase